MESLCVTTVVQGNKPWFFFHNPQFFNIQLEHSWFKQHTGFLMWTVVLSAISQPFSPTVSHGVCAHGEFSISRKRANLSLNGWTLSFINIFFSPMLFLKLLRFFVYLIFSLFCSVFCTCCVLSQKATALHQPLIDFFSSHILCSLVYDLFYTAIQQDSSWQQGDL